MQLAENVKVAYWTAKKNETYFSIGVEHLL